MSLKNKIESKLVKPLRAKIFRDRRCQFNDFSLMKPEVINIRSSIMQFYSSNNNIGNFMPVLGIHQMLGEVTDTWCIHDKNIDFDFINRNYKCVIVGGAGLLHECFESFWRKLSVECRLPIVIWGVGVCLPDQAGVRSDLAAGILKSGVSRSVVAEVVRKCELINVRDNLTATHYQLKTANISACPTVVYVEQFKGEVRRNSKQILYSSHKELVNVDEQQEIYNAIAAIQPSLIYTDNIQQYGRGIEDIIGNYYCRSRLVVTTRLHGAITAYGLGLPYIAIPRDSKLRDFCAIYSNGLCLDDVQELPSAIHYALGNDIMDKEIQIEAVKEFGRQAKDWIASKTIVAN